MAALSIQHHTSSRSFLISRIRDKKRAVKLKYMQAAGGSHYPFWDLRNIKELER